MQMVCDSQPPAGEPSWELSPLHMSDTHLLAAGSSSLAALVPWPCRGEYPCTGNGILGEPDDGASRKSREH